MSAGLTGLSGADIRARCSEASFDRGRRYYTGGAVQQRIRSDDGIEAQVAGASMYRVTVKAATSGRFSTYCTCPYDWDGECKHIVATLLAWMNEPESFRTAADLQTALAARSKEALADILADICTIYPHLVDDFGLLGGVIEYDPDAVVDAIFTDMDPPGPIDIDEAVARMEMVARRAERFARQGQGELARRAYYTLTHNCVHFCESYGAHDVFPSHIPYVYAEAYRGLVLEQLGDHANVIEQEVRDMLRGEWAPEFLGVVEALDEVWFELGLG